MTALSGSATIVPRVRDPTIDRPVRIATEAPKAAALEIPVVKGLAMGLPVMICMPAPATARSSSRLAPRAMTTSRSCSAGPGWPGRAGGS